MALVTRAVKDKSGLHLQCYGMGQQSPPKHAPIHAGPEVLAAEGHLEKESNQTRLQTFCGCSKTNSWQCMPLEEAHEGLVEPPKCQQNMCRATIGSQCAAMHMDTSTSLTTRSGSLSTSQVSLFHWAHALPVLTGTTITSWTCPSSSSSRFSDVHRPSTRASRMPTNSKFNARLGQPQLVL